MAVHGVCLYIDSTLPYKEELGNRLLQHAVTVIAWIACVLKYKKQDTIKGEWTRGADDASVQYI